MTLEFIGLMIFMLAGTYLVHGTGYGEVLKGVWAIVTVLVMSKFIPGVGANSTISIVMFIFLWIVAIFTIPEFYRNIMATTRDILAPSQLGTMKSDAEVLMESSTCKLDDTHRAFSKLKLGHSQENSGTCAHFLVHVGCFVWTRHFSLKRLKI